MIISKTPFRISFFGGGSDYPAWYRGRGGGVLGTAIDKYCYVSCRYLPPFFEHRIRVVYSLIELCNAVDEIRHPAVREALKYLGVSEGVEIHHDADLPARTGIGSSSSFTVGLLHALHALKGRMASKRDLMDQAIHLEQEVMRENVGSQDQALAAWGGFNLIEFQADGGILLHPMALPRARVEDLERHLMLFFTGFSRTASEIAGGVIREIPNRQRELEAMCAYAREAAAILGSPRDLGDFGRLLHESWLLKRTLSGNVSTPAIDRIYEQARSAGAVGGKLLGAGGGGFFLLFVPPERQRQVRQALDRLLYVPFRFSAAGSQILVHEPDPDSERYGSRLSEIRKSGGAP